MYLIISYTFDTSLAFSCLKLSELANASAIWPNTLPWVSSLFTMIHQPSNGCCIFGGSKFRSKFFGRPKNFRIGSCESRGICWVDISGDMHPIFCIQIPCFERYTFQKMFHHPANQNESNLIYQNARFAGLSFNWESSMSTKPNHKTISRNTVKWKSLASYMSQWYSTYLGTEQQRLAWDSLNLEG